MKKLLKYTLILALPISFILSLNPAKPIKVKDKIYSSCSKLTKADSG